MRSSAFARWLLPGIALLGPMWAASLQGTVTDPSGKPIPQARVSLYAREGSEKITSLTDHEGVYRFDLVSSGEYLIQADSEGMARGAARPVTVAATGGTTVNLVCGLAEVRSEVLVTATGTPQSTDEIAKSVDSLHAGELSQRAIGTVTEAVRSTAGLQVQTLGGPGAFTRILTRGLRPQDTAITIDGLRFRDAATTQGDATPFLEDLALVDSERIEVLRGTGSSVYGSNAIGGVINLITDSGGGPTHGEVRAEGGGLGMMRGLAHVSGSAAHGMLGFSSGLQYTDVLRGVDGDDRFRGTSGQGSVRFRPSQATSITAYGWASDTFTQINSTPYSAPASLLPPRGVIVAVPVSLDVQHLIEAGRPFSYGTANLVPNLDDPDSRRSGRFLSGALVANHRFNERISARVSYHKVITRRWFDDGPAGVRFPAAFSVSDRIRGGTDTVEGRAEIRAARWNTISAGYEFERETYRSMHVDFAPPTLAHNYDTGAGQRDHSFFFSDQLHFLQDRLQIGVAGRLQQFSLRNPTFAGGVALYQGVMFQAPPRAKTGDVSAAYFVATSGTKLRAHVGNGYRSPSIFERFGSSFFDGSFTALGDPRLRPERTVAFDTGLDQYLVHQRLRISGTFFYTNLQETIAFDSSGFLVARLDPFGRSSGYINSGGGVARGTELSAEVAVTRTTKVNAAYTYTNSDQRRSTVRDRDFFQTSFISPHVFTSTVTQRVGARIDVAGDLWFANRNPAIFSSRAFLLAGPHNIDLVANYHLPIADRARLRLYGKVTNLLDSSYLVGGYRAAGRSGVGGVSWEF
jgi:vitamin B12 transporter